MKIKKMIIEIQELKAGDQFRRMAKTSPIWTVTHKDKKRRWIRVLSEKKRAKYVHFDFPITKGIPAGLTKVILIKNKKDNENI